MKKLLILLFFLPTTAYAASLSPNQLYTNAGDPQGVFTATAGNSCYFFDNSNTYQGEQQSCNGAYFMGGDLFSIASGDFNIDGTFGAPPLHITVIEAGADNEPICRNGINDCRALPGFVNEFTVSVLAAPPSGDKVPSTSSGIPQYGPDISISFPDIGTVFSRLGIISYKATDLNDQGKENERDIYGLSKTPVTLYYSDKVAEWDGSSSVAPANKMLIAADQPAEASYAWQIADLVPGIFYRIIADVVDVTGTLGETVSDFFTVDFSAPTFIVKADPPVTRGKDVTVSVDASENLGAPPTVVVTQAGGVATPLIMKGQGSHYEGTYAVAKGYDGVALIAVSGTDVASNVGTTTLSGGAFAVGVNPPPAPRISAPQNNAVVGTSTIAVAGFLPRPDTVAVLLVNGIDTYTASSSPGGAFTIANIRLSKDANHGLNILSAAARDITGLLSEAVPLRVKYNIAPTVAISSPAEKATVSATTPLSARAVDENTDPLSFTYQIIPAQNFDATQSATSTKSVQHSVLDNEWNTIGDIIPSANFSWDSTEAEDGQYFLRVIADDGFAQVYSTPSPFSIHNTLPFFRFEDGRKTLTNQSSVTIVGRALTPSALTPRPTITKVEYSVDNGKKWKSVMFASGGTPEARFSITFNELTEGTRGILWRVKDSRNFYGRASHPVIVDTTPPRVPLVNYPANNAFVTNADDEDASRDGLQISVSGTAEPQSTITLQTASTTMTAKARVDGSFVFRSIDVPQKGTNQFRVMATDGAGNASTASSVRVVYDNPPTVAILAPKPFRGLTGKRALVSWSVSDADGDPIRNVALEYRRGQGAFIPLAIDNQSVKHSVLDTFLFDVSAFPEATDYQLRLSAGDGMATGTDIVNFSVDRTPPILSSFTLDVSVLGKGGVLLGHGAAQDSLSGIEYVEYALAEGADKPTLFSTALLTGGFLQENAAFTLKYPATLPDGIYNVYARAVDAAGNVSPALSRALVVDTSPPRIGSFDVLAQGVRIAPDAQGVISLYANTDALFEISLEGDTDTASLSLGTTTVPLKKDIASGLWQAPVDTGALGTTTLAISAKDNVRNAFTAKPIGALSVAARPSAAPAAPKTGGVLGFLRRIINYLLSL